MIVSFSFAFVFVVVVGSCLLSATANEDCVGKINVLRSDVAQVGECTPLDTRYNTQNSLSASKVTFSGSGSCSSDGMICVVDSYGFFFGFFVFVLLALHLHLLFALWLWRRDRASTVFENKNRIEDFNFIIFGLLLVCAYCFRPWNGAAWTFALVLVLFSFSCVNSLVFSISIHI